MLAIFGFRKNRSQTLSNQGPESEAEVYEDGCHTVATALTGTALENVYTLLQPPRSAARAGSPGDGADGKMSDHQGKGTLVLSPPPIPGISHPAMGGGKHPFFSPREVSEVDPVFEADRYWADDKQRTTDVLQADNDWMLEGQLRDPHAERHWFDGMLQERTFGEQRMNDRQTDRYWTENRHPDRHLERQWTVDKHTQRQIDRKIEKQWMGGRQIERSWSENRPMDMQVDNQGTESRWKLDRQVQTLLAQRPLPPYPSDRTPSPKQESGPLKNMEVAAAVEWHPQDSQGDRHTSPDAGGGSSVGRRSSSDVGGVVTTYRPSASKPDPPPQSSKPNLPKLRQRHRREGSDALPEEDGDEERDPGKSERRERRHDSESLPPPIPEKPKTSSYVTFPKEPSNERELPPPPVPPPINKPVHGLPDRAASQGEEGLRPQAPVKPQRNRKAVSCDAGKAPTHY
uniref:Leucine rich repeat containing 16B n=1 Tax=Nothobranchius rachovii TaxID=451742 RepID=A0A1A8PWV6_9TELE